MPTYDILCANGHDTEVTRPSADRHAPCPACGAPVELLWRATRIGVQQDSIPGGFLAENGFDRPTRFDSWSEYKQAIDRNGYQIRERWVPGDKHLTNWAAVIDAGTLENAKTLVSRMK